MNGGLQVTHGEPAAALTIGSGGLGLTRTPCPSLPAPVFLTVLQNQEVQDGYPVSFDCVVIGQPVPSVRWFKDGRLLEEDDHYMISDDQQGGHQLIITAVVPADMGVYRCLAENSVGVSSTKAELRVDCEYGWPGLLAKGGWCGDSWLGGAVLGWRMVQIWGLNALWPMESSLGTP